MGAGAPGMDDAFGEPFAVESPELLQQVKIVQQNGTVDAGGPTVLIVADGAAVVLGQPFCGGCRGGLFRNGDLSHARESK